MTQYELDTIIDVTPQILPEIRIINGRTVVVPVQKSGTSALYIGPEDGYFICSVTGKRYIVGWYNGVRVKRISNDWGQL